MADRSAQTTQSVSVRERAPHRLDERTQRTVFAGGSVLGAVAMSSCCIVPLVLFSVGVTGAWIGNLTALYPYKPYFFIATTAFLGFGFYKVYRKPSAVACDANGQCGTPMSFRITKVALWLSAALVLVAVAFPYYAPLLLDS